MMKKHLPHQPDQFGWGKNTAKLDPTKQHILQEFVVGNTTLDAGCATGIYTTAKNRGLSIGCDWNFDLLKSNKHTKSKSFIQSNILQLPLKKKSIDTTIMFDILEHIPKDVAIREAKRVTKKRLIITVPRTTDKELSDNFLLFGHHQDTTHLRTYNIHSATKTLKKHHLTPIIIKPIHPISTDSLILDILDGPLIIKRAIRKLAFTLLNKKTFYSNLLIVADI